MSDGEALHVLDAERDAGGRFTVGNPGGPGRPRRAVELTYLRALSDELSLEDWRAIVRRAVEDARQGDAKAREWVARYALGPDPAGLMDLAVRDELGLDDGHEVRAMAKDESTPSILKTWRNNSPVEQALDVMRDDEAEAEAERKRERRRIRQAERQAQAGQGETPAEGGQ